MLYATYLFISFVIAGMLYGTVKMNQIMPR